MGSISEVGLFRRGSLVLRVLVRVGLLRSRAAERKSRTVIEHLRNLADHQAADYINNNLLGAETAVFSSKKGLRNFFFSAEAVAERPGEVLDFGVAKGDSTVMLGDALLGDDCRKTIAFDAFFGIRDAWSKPDRTAGSMSLGGVVPPRVARHEKVEVVVGWVEDTLPVFLAENPGVVGIAHLDMDVYPATKFVLEALGPRLEQGSLLVFDDFFGFIGWQNHSHRAFTEVFNLSSFRCVGVSPNAIALEYRGGGVG